MNKAEAELYWYRVFD